MPTVSVIIPGYRHAAFVADCIQSVRSQTFEDWEAVVLDDCSPDETYETALKAAEGDPRFRVLRNESNLGAYGTEQRLLELTSAPWVAVLNSDDLWLPTKLETQLRAAAAAPDCAACFTLGWKIDEHGTENTTEDVHADWPIETAPNLADRLMVENRILASSVLFRREGLQFDASCRYSGDWVALLSASLRGPLICVPERLTRWRMHSRNSYVASRPQLLEELRVRWAIQQDRALRALGSRRAFGENALRMMPLATFFNRRDLVLAAGIQALLSAPDRGSALRRILAAVARPAHSRAHYWRMWAGEAALPEPGTAQFDPIRFA
jgi:glycosyltransferase involved in cell wall biosynthesis